jgi:hypothetical protein
MTRLRARRVNRPGLNVELLEDRTVPSCTINQTGGMLLIKGSAGHNFIAITDNGTGKAHNVTVKCGNGVLFTSGTDPVTEITVKTGPGVDVVDYALNGDASNPMAVDVLLGAGRDTFNGHLNGHQLLSGANYAFTLHGGAGVNDLDFAADDNVHIAAGASLTVNDQGGAGRANLSARYHGLLDGTLDFDLGGGRGANVLNAVANPLPGSTGSVSVTTHTGGGA